MERDLTQLSGRRYDVLVLGAGIYGAWTAWDAALRGLSVALVDKGDFGHATSSNTLRVIHGGFRYLQHGDIRRMRQSIRERATLMRLAPHLVQPLPFLIPTYGHAMRGKEAFTLALLANDCVGFDRNHRMDPHQHLPRGRILSKDECIRRFPGVDQRGLTGGAICYDGQLQNSERLLLSIVRSATSAGADAANYVEAIGPLRERRRIAGITARDVLTGDTLEIRTKIVVNTCGPWLQHVSGLMNGRRPAETLALSKAFNLCVRRQFAPEYAVGVYGKGAFQDRDAILRKGSRLFFITPWRGFSLIGTAHLPYNAEPDSFHVTEEEIHTFLDEINDAYPAAQLERQEVARVYAGLLPAGAVQTGDVQLIKRHRIHDERGEEGLDGLISVMGVKFTEARHVAEKGVDLVFRKLGRTPPKCATAVTPLYGGQIPRFLDFLAQAMSTKPRGLDAEALRRLICHYGSAYPEVLPYLDGGAASPHPSTDGARLRKAEVLYATRQEMARKLTDVVLRRLSFGTVEPPDATCLSPWAAIMATELGWDDRRLESEVEEALALSSMPAAAGDSGSASTEFCHASARHAHAPEMP
jgi:glycerol-3-phosphate dehydrogenase